MQIAQRENSARRQHYQQQLNAQGKNNESSDIDGMVVHRVASVTLESDSLSADQPMCFRSKRRRKIPRKEKQQEMDVDDQNHRQDCGKGEQQNHSSAEGDALMVGNSNNFKSITACKVQMEWEESDIPVMAENKNRPSASDLENNQSDVVSELSEESISNGDADDEQSDWPEFIDKRDDSIRSKQSILLQPEPKMIENAALSLAMVKKIESFLKDPGQKELLLDQVYRTSAIKQMLRKQQCAVQIVKKGRGTIALKKA